MKRSVPMRRAPLRATAPAKAEAKIPNARKCKTCGDSFRPFKGIQTWCSPDCGVKLAAKLVAKKEAREHKKAVTDAKPLSHWLALTERVVNAYILARDRERPCVSCGTFKTVQWEAGHYRNVGSYPEIRFDPRNITKQCHRCNCDLHGNKDNYRIGYVERNGQEPMDWLEGPHPLANYTREGLAETRRIFAKLTRELEKQCQN